MTNCPDKDLYEHDKNAVNGGNLGRQIDLDGLHELCNTGHHSAFKSQF